MRPRNLKVPVLLVVMALMFPTASHSGNFFDFFRVSPSPETDSGGGKRANSTVNMESRSDCGKQIETFRKFMHDGKICKQDDDCITMPGNCLLGCKFYINKNFEQIINTEMNKVSDVCTESICTSKCSKLNVRPVCIENKCQARTK